MKASIQPVQPSRKEFLALAREHTLVPVCRILTADLETPVSAFLRAAWPERECFLLESVESGEQVGRYTFIGLAPFKRIVARGREITITEGKKVVQIEGDIFAVLRRALAGHKPARLPGLPPFTAGAVGFFAYDAVRQIERLPELAKDELGVPDACLLFFDEVLAFDHVRKEIWLVVTADVTRGKPAKAYDKAVERLDKLEKRLAQPLPKLPAHKAKGKLKVKHRTGQKGFPGRRGPHQGVHRRRRYLSGRPLAALRRRAGGGQLPGLSRPAHRQSQPLYVLSALCAGRSAGRACPISRRHSSKKSKATARSLELAGSSPELLVRVHEGKVEYRPIAGTRPRGATEKEDQALAERDAPRRKGARRARDAGGPGPQRRGPRKRVRLASRSTG